MPGSAPACVQDEGSRQGNFAAQSHSVSSRCLSLRIQGQFFDFFWGMLATSWDNAIADHMDTLRWSDLLSINSCLSSGIARLSGPTWDRANRVTQVCHLERIAPEARSPNWPYGRLDRAPLSVPLETTLGAPRRGAKTTCERWQNRSVASDVRIPVADNPPSSIDQLHDNSITTYAQPHTASLLVAGSWNFLLILARGSRWGLLTRRARLTQPRHCPVAVVPDTLQELGRRIGQRGDAT
jgi:hypothetical protein